MERKGESELGILSLGLSILASVGFFLELALIYGFFGDDYSSGAFIAAFFVGVLIVFCGGLSFCSLVLGLAGIFQNTRVRKYAFIGTTFSVSLLCFYIVKWIALII